MRGTCLPVTSEMAAARFDLQNLPSAAAVCFGAAYSQIQYCRMASGLLWDRIPVTGSTVPGPRSQCLCVRSGLSAACCPQSLKSA